MKCFFALLLSFYFMGAAYAQTITFDGLGVNTQNPVTVDGYDFAYSNQNGWAIGNESNLSAQIGNGSDFILVRDTRDRDSSITMSGPLFDLTSFDAADGLLNIGGRSIEVTGFLSGGGSVVANFTTVANTFTTYFLSGLFSNLTAVEFHSFGQLGDGLVLDNIVLNGNLNPVPIPAAAFMFAPALLGFMGLRRKAKNSVA